MYKEGCHGSPASMSQTLFISDLHLNADEPATVQRFEGFCRGIAPGSDAVYILGDFFEYWAGDDDASAPFNSHIVTQLQQLSAQVGALYLLHGNRDFLLGATFAEKAGVTLLPDPTVVDLYGRRAILAHGDALCTDDVAYQQFRAMVRNPQWQTQFLTQPLAVRKAIAEDLRRKSEASKQEKSAAIMDVNAEAVAALLRQYGQRDLIHGHTHRPACHALQVDGANCQRWVLPDWYEGKWGYLRCTPSEWQLLQY